MKNMFFNAAGGYGFGVGICPEDSLPASFEPLDGFNKNNNPNQGNYQTTNGSIMVFIPAFYYRIGSNKSPRFLEYGLNCIDIASISDFESELDANNAGYVLHRAFIDGGVKIKGFFIDKYLASKDNDNSCKSIPNADPISLSEDINFNPSSDMLNCIGNYADAITLARARGKGFHCASAFQYSALGLLSLAHGQAATGTTYCAWYDPNKITNYPKGCNNGELGNVEDSEVSYASSYQGKPKTRAISGFEKTTHNGQANGVADLNGCIYQVLLGVTSPGETITDTKRIPNENLYVLKETIAMADLTSRWNGKNDAWGDKDNLENKYWLVNDLLPYGREFGWHYISNKDEKVFSSDVYGRDYFRTSIAISSTLSNDRNNLFGNSSHYNYHYHRANLLLLGSGYWDSHLHQGIFTRYWGHCRNSSSHYVGFRAAYSEVI